MRWNCPHCGTNLAVADEKVGSGWSFSRCYKCAGYGLVRRSDVTLIKVDRAPEGEPVLLPEAHENATTMLSKTATLNLNRYTTEGEKPVVRTAPPKKLALPEPLPKEPLQKIGQRLAPLAIGLAGVLTIGSGIYLYVQGQALFEKARTQAQESSMPASPEALSSNASLDGHQGEHGPEVILAPSLPMEKMTSLAGSAEPATNVVVSDEVHARAMAPNREAAAKVPDRTSKHK